MSPLSVVCLLWFLKRLSIVSARTRGCVWVSLTSLTRSGMLGRCSVVNRQGGLTVLISCGRRISTVTVAWMRSCCGVGSLVGGCSVTGVVVVGVGLVVPFG